MYFTKSPNFTYSSETTLYTGLASGSSVEMGKSLNYFATNTDFDNLINVINSRETQQEVAIRLLALHLMLLKPDPRYISPKSFDYLKKITPGYVKSLVVQSNQKKIPSNSKAAPLPRKTESGSPTPQYQAIKKHTVTANETLFSIARKYETVVDSIKRLNGLTGNNIRVGQILQITSQIFDNPVLASKDTIETIIQKDSSSTFSFSKLYASSQGTKLLPASIDDSESSRDFSVLYWRVLAAIKSTKVFVWDKQPWEAPDNWIGSDPDSRLAKLYHDLRAYAYVLEDNRGELKALGISSGKITYLSGLKLSINKIIGTLSILSQWRFKKLTGHQAAFIISTVWSRK